ncbi:sensor histidine kinase [Propioniciclava flava]|uniref:histidine kinase n=1 Tax=Propioniciclava flava TaxID=2072026 RepID=A0A4Q2EJV2_9ACTN|nr:sensor histidine kinase [Propioniciclava flava]RXW32245.1 two-component sensor histidine kinase [Propioniciclava flava]
MTTPLPAPEQTTLPRWRESSFWIPRPTDAMLAALVMFVALDQWYVGGGSWFLLRLVGIAIPLLWRLKFPDLVALAIIPVHLLQVGFAMGPSLTNIAVPIMLYTVAAYGRERWRNSWLIIGFAAALLAAISWSGMSWHPDVSDMFALAASFTAMASLVAASWAIGSAVRSRSVARDASLHALLAQQQQYQQAMLLTATQERQRLAREMHDVVAHSLAVIVVQADGGAYAAGMDGDPEKRLAVAERALTTIRTTAQESLAETRRLVGVLRDGQAPELSPAANLGDLQGIIQGLVDAGRDVRLEVTGDVSLRRLLTPAMELAIVRIVQEALTNAVKHAGPDAAVRVRIHHSPAGVSLQIRDNGKGAGVTDGLGHGLVGMRERVAAFGGTMAARNHITGGFVIEAFIPTNPGATA